MQQITADPSNSNYSGVAFKVLFTLNNLIKAIDMQEKKAAQCHGISQEKISVLKEIFFYNVNTLSELTYNLNSTEDIISNILSSLLDSNLIVRFKIDTQNYWTFKLTDSGEEFLNSIDILKQNFMNNLMSIPESKRAQIFVNLQHLEKLLEPLLLNE